MNEASGIALDIAQFGCALLSQTNVSCASSKTNYNQTNGGTTNHTSKSTETTIDQLEDDGKEMDRLPVQDGQDESNADEKFDIVPSNTRPDARQQSKDFNLDNIKIEAEDGNSRLEHFNSDGFANEDNSDLPPCDETDAAANLENDSRESNEAIKANVTCDMFMKRSKAWQFCGDGFTVAEMTSRFTEEDAKGTRKRQKSQFGQLPLRKGL